MFILKLKRLWLVKGEPMKAVSKGKVSVILELGYTRMMRDIRTILTSHIGDTFTEMWW